MSFDVEAARKAGYSDSEIADHLSGLRDFDARGARSSGYSDSQIIEYLAQKPVDLRARDVAGGVATNLVRGAGTALTGSTVGAVDSAQRIGQRLEDSTDFDLGPAVDAVKGAYRYARGVADKALGGPGNEGQPKPEPTHLRVPNPLGRVRDALIDISPGGREQYERVEQAGQRRGIRASGPIKDTWAYQTAVAPALDAAAGAVEGLKPQRFQLAEQAFARDLDAAASLDDPIEQAKATISTIVGHPAVVSGVIAQSAPSMAASILTGRAVLGAGSRLVAKEALEQGMNPELARSLAATWANTRGAKLAALAVAGNATAQSVSSTVDEVAAAIEQTPDQVLMQQSPRYREARQYLTEQEAKQAMMATARTKTANSVALTTGLSSLLTAGFEAKIGMPKGLAEAERPMFARRVLEGILKEGAQETFESGGEQYGQNSGLIESGASPDMDPMQGVVGQGVLGGVAGAVMGGAAGLARSTSLVGQQQEPSISDSTPSPEAGQDSAGGGVEAGVGAQPVGDKQEAAPGPIEDDEIAAAFQTIESKGTDDSNLDQVAGGDGSGSPDNSGSGTVGDQDQLGVGISASEDADPAASAGGDEALRAIRGEAGEPQLPLDQAAHEAATSPHNDLPEPSEAQREAGNYRKGHIKVQGLDISIENPQGSTRSGTDRDGKTWSVQMQDHYGYFRLTKGKDKEHIDTFVGPSPDAGMAYVVDQVEPSTGKFDEHKVMLGYASENEAREAYRRNYSEDWRGLGAITAMPVSKLKEWLSQPQVKPVGKLSKLTGMDDLRLKNAEARSDLEAMAPDAGWAEIGGLGLRTADAGGTDQAYDVDETGRPTGDIVARTPWVPRAPWFPVVQREAGLPGNSSGAASMAAVRKALAGEPMTKAEKRHVASMLDWADAERRDYEAQGASSIDPFDLAGVSADEELGGAVSLVDEALVAKALEMDEAAFERAATRFADDDVAFMAAIRSIVDGQQEADRSGEGGTVGSDRQEIPGQEAEAGRAGGAEQLGQAQGQVGGEVNGQQELSDSGTTEGQGGRTLQASAPEAGRHVAGRVGASADESSQPPSKAQGGQAKPSAPEGDAPLVLESHTESDLAARAAEQAERESAGRAEERRSSEKAQADKDRDNFALTGSNRPADVSMAGGQRDLLSNRRIDQQEDGTVEERRSADSPGARWDRASPEERVEILAAVGMRSTTAPGGATSWNWAEQSPFMQKLISGEHQPSRSRSFAPLRIEPYGGAGKLIVVRGETRTYKNRIKAIGGALWNAKAEGWTFRADLEPRVRAALGDLLPPERVSDSAGEFAGDTLLLTQGKTDGKSENAAEPEGLQARDRREDRRDGRAGEPDRGSLGGGLAETHEDAGSRGQAARSDSGPDGERDPGQESGVRESLDGGDRDAANGGPQGRPAGIVDEPPGDHVIADGDQVGEGGERTKARNNIAAIELVKQLAVEGRSATADERRTLSRYVGWGGLKRVFDPKMSQMSHFGERLRGLLTAEEYEAARASILDAHYTSIPIVDAIWAAVGRMGFDGGRVVEPAVGTGNFFGRMPTDISARSVLNGIEKDHITGLIAQQLYQRADIAINGFEDVSYPADSADLVVGNPPFGSQVLYDAAMPTATRGFSIHNFFFAKAVEITRPGGLVAMVVSHNLMDQQDATARRWIAERAHLRGAVRLPYTAFLSNAGTEVVTDILFLQKAMPGESPDTRWAETRELALLSRDGTSRVFQTSAWFHDHPEMVLGTQDASGKMYGRPDQYNVAPAGGESLGEQIAAAIQALPAGVYVRPDRPVEIAATRDALVPDHTKVYGYFLSGDGETVMQRIEDTFDGKPQSVPVEFKDKTSPRRAAGLIGVRDALRSLMRAEMTQGVSDAHLTELRGALNGAYDRFLKQFGYINSQTNRRSFRDDPDLPLLESLEPRFDPGISREVAKKRAVDARPATAGKADIFSKRVLSPSSEVKSAGTAKDALVASLNLFGGINPAYMSEIYGKDFEGIVGDLGDLIYQNPDGRVWETAEVYLSGNVKHKLKQAKAAVASDSRFERNVSALELVQPADVPALKIGVRLGSPWVPGEVIEDFARVLLGSGAKPVARFVRSIGRWSIDIGGADRAASISRWGTERVPAPEVMSAVMNNKQILVRDNVGSSAKPVWVVNEPETEAARARAEEMAAKFKEWIWEDADRRVHLERIYNDGYNTDRRRRYDGSHLTLPGSRHAVSMALGMQPGDPGALILRKHQLSAIWRGVQEPNVLLDHVVGAGKTYEMAAIALELRRIGISRKPMLAVPNHLVRQWRDEFYKLYPNANVLAATEADFEKKNRGRLFARIATGDWDAIVVGHSSFEKIGAPVEAQSAILKEQLDEIADAIESVKRERGDRHVLRDMERIKQNLTAKLKKLADSAGDKDDVVDFGELGIDALFVDEAHLFKNLFYMSQMRGVAGLGAPEGSGRAFDLFVKTQFLQKRYGKQARVVFATGTPVSNSLVEMYTMQRYLAYRELQRRGIATLDAWAGVYGDVQNIYEVHPSGTGYRLKTRFAKFVNLPSLMELYRSFADVVSLDDLKEQAKAQGGRFPVPNIKGGKPRNVVAERSDLQTAFFGVPEFERDEAGAIKFKYPADLRPEITGDGKWILVGSPSFPGKDGESQWTRHAGPFDSEADAKEQAEALIRQPVVGYNKDSILWKFENLKQLNKTTNGKINALSVTNEARKAGLDYRLIDPSAPDFAGSKLNLAVADIVRIYKAWQADLGTQLVFCDLSTPKSARASAATKEKPAFVRNRDGSLRQVRATVAAIDGQPVAFLVVKDKPGQFIVFDGFTGAELPVKAGSREDAVSALRSRLASGSHWVDEARELYSEIDDDAIAAWKAQQETSEESTEDEDDSISVGDLMSMGGTGSRFSVYDDVKEKLVKAGIPDKEIAFIHDYDTAAKKNELYKLVRAGAVRVLMGSTEKLGAGTNVQERLVGLAHLDAPWRPSDLEQREGRIIRQGNILYERDPDGFEVEINRYATRQTYDTRMWQLIEHKAAGVEQLRKADATVFEIDDIGGEEANAADMKAAASGNPLILEEIKLRNEVRSLEAQQYAHQGGLMTLQDRVRHARGARARSQKEISEFKPLMVAAKENPAEPFSYAAGTRLYTDKREAATPLLKFFKEVSQTRNGEVVAGQYRGGAIVFSKDLFGIEVSLHSGDSEVHVASYGKDDSFSPGGLFIRIDNALASLPGRERDLLQRADRAEAEIPSLEVEIARPFGKTDELVSRRSQHRKVMNQLAKAGGGIELTSQMQRELKAAIRARLGLGADADQPAISAAVREAAGAPAGAALSASAARAIAEQALGAIGVTALHRQGVLEFVDRAAQLSPAQQDYIERFEAEHPGKRIVAFVDHGIGRAYIVSDRVRAADVPGLIMHEVGSHFGLPAMIGVANYRRLLGEIRLMRQAGSQPALNAAWDHVATHYPSLPQTSTEFASEVLARLSESEAFRALPVWRRVLSWVRQFLFRLGLTRVWNLRDEDLGQMVAAALRRTLVQGAVTPTAAGEFGRAVATAGPESAWGSTSGTESPLYQAIDAGLSKKGGAAIFKSMISGLLRRQEVESADLEASGLMDWLDTQGASLTKEDVLDHLSATGGASLALSVRAGNRMVPITELNGAEWVGSSRELMLLAKQVYEDTLRQTTVENSDLAAAVGFTAEGKKEAFHPIRHPIDAQVVEALLGLVRNAALLESREPTEKRAGDSSAFHTLVAPLRFKGHIHVVKITVREAKAVPPGGTRMRFYDVSVLRNALAPAKAGASGVPGSATSGLPGDEAGVHPFATETDTGVSLRQLAEIVKPGLGQRFSASVRGDETPPTSHAQRVEEDAWRKAGMPVRNRSLRERIESWATERWETVREEFLDNLQTGVFDRFKPIKDAEGNIDPARSGYVSARLSTGGSSVLYASMLFGAPEFSGGVIQKKEGSRGLLQILEPVAADLNRWAAWMVGKRADMLASQQRENNLTLEEIAYLKSLAGADEERYEAVAREVRGFMTDVLKLMQKAGLLTASQVDDFSKDGYYLPFYRVNEADGDATFPFIRRGLSHQASQVKRLKGGAMAINDPIENLFAHLSRSIDASMKNYAMARTITNTARHLTPAKEGHREKAVRVMWDGKPYWFNVDEPALLRALTAVGEKPKDNIALNIGRSMRSLLTTGVTLDPAFMARNFIRDSMHSWMIDKNAMKFGSDSIRGAGATLKTIRAEAQGRPEDADVAVVSMMFAGASFVGGHVYGGDPRANAAALRKALHRKGLTEQESRSYMDSLVTSGSRFASLYVEVGEAIENANRVAAFKAAQDGGMPLVQALYESKDLMDFSLRGQWATVQVLADVLPFFNARLQGLYKLGREARRDPRVIGLVATRIAARGALMALAATALVAAYSGDDRYEQLEEWDKDANWHFWVNGVHYRIPKPFELGLVFGTIPERLYRLAGGYDRFGEYAQALGRGLVTTLEFNPIPQALRPLSEIYFNFDMFRQRPIESDSDQNKLPADRYGAHTSPTMVAVGQATGISPKKLEYAWNGYLGTLGAYVLSMADSLARVARGEVTPAKHIEDYPIIGSFARTGPAWNTEYLTELYDLSQEAEQTWKSIRDKYESGDEAGGDRLAEDKAGLLEVREMLGEAKRRISALRRQRDAVMRDQTISAEGKRDQLDEIQREINDVAREAMLEADSQD